MKPPRKFVTFLRRFVGAAWRQTPRDGPRRVYVHPGPLADASLSAAGPATPPGRNGDSPPCSRPEGGASPVARFTAFCRNLWTTEAGATALEYALLLAVLSALGVSTAASLGVRFNGLFLRAGGSLPDEAGVL